MTYLKSFTTQEYSFASPDNKTPVVYNVPDIMTRVSMLIKNEHTKNILFDPYIIQEGETPERISYGLYGTTFYQIGRAHV